MGLLPSWDSPGKSTGVDWVGLSTGWEKAVGHQDYWQLWKMDLGGVHACEVTSLASDSLLPYGLQPARFPCPWDSPGSKTGVGCHALFRGIVPPQGSNSHLLRLLPCRQIFFFFFTLLSHQGSTLGRCYTNIKCPEFDNCIVVM